MSKFGGNYTPEEWAEVKAKRRVCQRLEAEHRAVDEALALALRVVLRDRQLVKALRQLLAIDPRHPLVKLPKRVTKKIDHYQVSRKVHSPKSNPELVLGPSITRTVYHEADTFTGLDLTREECELFGVIKIWNHWQHEDEYAFRQRLTEHLCMVLEKWEAAGRALGPFILNAIEEKEQQMQAAGIKDSYHEGGKRPRRKKGEGGDAMDRRSTVSLDVLMAMEVR